MRVYLEAYGCAQNQGEAHALVRDLTSHGHRMASDPAEADVGVLVTCGVIGSTEARMVRRWRALSERIPRMVVTGCLVPLRTDLLTGPGRARTTFLPIRQQPQLPAMLAEFSTPQSVEPPALLSLPSEPPSVVEEVVIAQGCTSHCTYCFSRLARGRLSSVPVSAVVERIRSAVVRGAVEVRLTSLDTSCWGVDLSGQSRLPDLLRAVAEIPGDFQVRVGMMSPQSLKPIAAELWKILRAPRFFEFLHLPIQSGSNSVLEAMARGYTVEEARFLVMEARRRIPDLMLATDIIVGFPGETEEDFRASRALVRDLAPDIVNVTRFSPRPMTVAARRPPVVPRVVKRRSRELTEVRMEQARSRFERWVGRVCSARVVERGRGASSLARLPNYLPVVLDSVLALGQEIEVRIDGARSTYLLGRPLTLGEAAFEALRS